MKNYVIINGVNSNTITGLMINELPPISKPQMRVQTEEIDGRDGDITTNLGYSAYDKTFTIGLFGDGYDINDIVAFFNGEGTIVFSNESDKYYYYKIIDKIDYERLQKFKTASITVHVQPFKYPLEETPLEIEYEYVNGEGESITLNDTEGDVPLQLDPKGNTSQYTTTGKNKIHYVSGSTSLNNLSVIENDNGSINISGTPNKTWANLTPDIDFSLGAGTYTFSINKTLAFNLNIRIYNDYETDYTIVTINAGETSKTITTTKTYIKYRIYIELMNTSTNYNITNLEMQLESGSSATDYEEYTGGNPAPSPSYPQPINVVSGDNTIRVEGTNRYNNELSSTIKQYRCTASYVNGEIVISATGTDCYFGEVVNTGNSWNNTYGELIFAKPNTKYSFKTTNDLINKNYVTYYNESKVSLGTSSLSNFSVFTTPNNTKYIQFRVGYGSSVSGTDYKTNIMLVEGQYTSETIPSYEPYQSQTYPIYLGVENLFDKDNANSLDSVWNSNAIVSNATGKAIYIPCQHNTTYTISKNEGKTFRVATTNNQPADNVPTISSVANHTGTSITITTESNANYIWVNYFNTANGDTGTAIDMMNSIQIEKGTKVNHTSTTPIELNKIGDYQDYFYKDSGKWYKYSAIGKVILKGSGDTELWGNGGSFENFWEYQRSGVIGGNGTMADVKTNYFNQTDNSRVVILGNGGLYLRFPKASGIDISNATLMNNWLSTHNTTVYYVLATPTNTEITDNTLIGQLEAIKSAFSYEGTTNVMQINNDKPFIISATAMKEGTNEIEIENIGNVYARPTLDIKGTGNISIYKDNNQILQLDMNDTNEIVIEDMEAYNPSTNELMNRKVIGNYDNITCPSGTCIYKVSGDLTKMTISNYTRWL